MPWLLLWATACALGSSPLPAGIEGRARVAPSATTGLRAVTPARRPRPSPEVSVESRLLLRLHREFLEEQWLFDEQVRSRFQGRPVRGPGADFGGVPGGGSIFRMFPQVDADLGAPWPDPLAFPGDPLEATYRP